MPEKNIKLTWDDFRQLGNPSNAEDENEEKVAPNLKLPLKVHYEKKGRGGKEAVIIRGFEEDTSNNLSDICKFIKSKIGIGGAVKDGEIILQGNQRDKIVSCLSDLGFTNIKKAGG